MGLDRVKSKVWEEVNSKAKTALKQAAVQVENIIAEGKAADERIGAQNLRDASLRLEREGSRELERIRYENRMQILSAKNTVIDEVFKRVNSQLASMSDSDYMTLLGEWLNKLPQDAGGVLRVNPRDESRFTAGLEELNRSRNEAGRFVRVESDPKIPDGVVVDGSDYSIDCTVTRRLGELRETAAGELAKVLFGTGGI